MKEEKGLVPRPDGSDDLVERRMRCKSMLETSKSVFVFPFITITQSSAPAHAAAADHLTEEASKRLKRAQICTLFISPTAPTPRPVPVSVPVSVPVAVSFSFPLSLSLSFWLRFELGVSGV